MEEKSKSGVNVVIYLNGGGLLRGKGSVIEFYDTDNVVVYESREDILIYLASSNEFFHIPKEKVTKWYKE